MKSFWGRALAVALLSAGGSAAWASDGHETREMKVIFDNGGGDRVEIGDLDELEVGDSRSYSTESGKPVVVTRDENGFEVDLDGKTVRIGDGAEGLAEPGMKVHRMQRIEMESDGHGDGMKTKSFVISDDPDREVVFIDGQHGEHSEHGFVFERKGLPPPPFVVEGLVSRLEKNEKFLSLDDATQQLVREAIRESAPDMHWVGLAGPGEEGAMKVIVRERSTKEEDDEEE